MADITIDFLGICTHIWKESTAAESIVFKETVCVAAYEERTLSDGNGDRVIPPHIPLFRVAGSDVVGDVPSFFPAPVDGIYSYEMRGVKITLLNPEGTLEPGEGFTHIASLSRLTPGIGPINDRVVANNIADESAMHFVTTGGTLTGYQTDHDAFIARLEVSNGDEENFSIQIDPYGGESATLVVNAGAMLTIVNDAATPELETNYDFLLHYLAVTPYPPNPGIPAVIHLPVLKKTHTWPVHTVGPSCSNSTYP